MYQPKIAVVIPTFRRPKMLLTALDSLASQTFTEPFLIVVADNDAEGREGIAAANRWCFAHEAMERVLTTAVVDRGISHTRNAGIASALTLPSVTLIAMIDDDASADPGWLRGLVDTQVRFDADVVCGPSIYELPDSAPPWARTAKPFHVVKRPTGIVQDQRSICNALITSRLVHEFGEVFDPAFGLSGGEDADFFKRCYLNGKRMAWAEDAIVHEPVDPKRIEKHWLLNRAYQSGFALARIDLKYKTRVAATTHQLGLAARTIFSGLLRLCLGHNADVRFDATARIYTGWGRISALLNRPSINY